MPGKSIVNNVNICIKKIPRVHYDKKDAVVKFVQKPQKSKENHDRQTV